MTTTEETKAVLAGSFISIGAMFSMAAASYGNVVQGLCFSIGLYLVVTLTGKLFTGAVMSVCDVWDRLASCGEYARHLAMLWGLNLIGAIGMAWLAWGAGFDCSAIATTKASLSVHTIVFRAALCNILVGLGVGMANAEDSLVGKFLAVAVPVTCFVACGFEHSIANMFYMALGAMNGAVTLQQFAYVVGVTTIGNLIGGIAFTKLMYEGEPDTERAK